MKEERIHPKARTEGSQGSTKRLRCLFYKKSYSKKQSGISVTQGDPASLRSRLCFATTLRKGSTARLRAPLRMTRLGRLFRDVVGAVPYGLEGELCLCVLNLFWFDTSSTASGPPSPAGEGFVFSVRLDGTSWAPSPTVCGEILFVRI